VSGLLGAVYTENRRPRAGFGLFSEPFPSRLVLVARYPRFGGADYANSAPLSFRSLGSMRPNSAPGTLRLAFPQKRKPTLSRRHMSPTRGFPPNAAAEPTIAISSPCRRIRCGSSQKRRRRFCHLLSLPTTAVNPWQHHSSLAYVPMAYLLGFRPTQHGQRHPILVLWGPFGVFWSLSGHPASNSRRSPSIPACSPRLNQAAAITFAFASAPLSNDWVVRVDYDQQ